MKQALPFALAFCLGGMAQPSWAGEVGVGSFVGSGSGSYLVVAAPEGPGVAEFIEVEADFVSLPVSIRSGNQDALERIKDVEATLASLLSEAEAFPDVIVTSGTVSITPASEKSNWSTPAYAPDTDSRLFLSAPLTPKTSVFSVAERVYGLLARVKSVGEAKVRVGATARRR